jgi:predicted transposase/invertase (TIGR01784 family)
MKKEELSVTEHALVDDLEESLKKDLTISNSFMFAKVMSEEPFCKEMLQRILGVKIRKIEYIEAEKTILTLKDAKDIRLDVYLEDNEDTVYDIECQMTDTHELPKRSRYYQSQIDGSLIDKGYHYSKLKRSYVIFICTFDPFEKGRHVYDFTRRCEGDPDLELKDETHVIFLNTTGVKNDCSKKLRNFLDHMNGRKVENDSFIEELDKSVAFNNKDKIWRKNVMTLAMEYMTREIMGEKRGEERGLKLGEERGLEKARYSDVAAGLYSPEKGAELLGVTLEDFLKGMKTAGYKLPSEVG